jgi:hypothetical protein
VRLAGLAADVCERQEGVAYSRPGVVLVLRSGADRAEHSQTSTGADDP